MARAAAEAKANLGRSHGGGGRGEGRRARHTQLQEAKATAEAKAAAETKAAAVAKVAAEAKAAAEAKGIVESTRMDGMHAAMLLLCTSLMSGLESVLSKAVKAGRHPSCTWPYTRSVSTWNQLPCRRQHDKLPAAKLRTQHPRIRCHWRPPSAARPRRSCW